MKKIKYIALALVLMLGLIGGAYAYWTDQVVISGNVTTAELNVKFEEVLDTDFNEDVRFRAGDNVSGSGSWSAPLAVADRGGATASAVISGEGKTLTYTVNNGWPWLMTAAFVTLKNESTIPVRLDSISITSGTHSEYMYPDPFYGFAYMYDGLTVAVSQFTGSDSAITDGSTWAEANYTKFSSVDDFIIPAETEVILCVSTYLYDGDLVDPNDTYDFTIELNWIQWNAP